jgi:acyl-CoA reductase-like NAD-dependent aldehyde dehydrogenase
MKIVSTNPSDGYKVVGVVETSTKEEVAAKVAAAQKAKLAWKELGLEARVKLLEPIRDEFAARVNEIAELITKEMGKPITESIGEVSRYTNGELTWFLENAPNALADEITLADDESIHKIRYEPTGVVAAIAPWNFPFGMAIWGIFPNLIAGNTVVFKTSEECPLTGKLVEEIINKHNLPEGVFSEVYGAGDVGKMLTESDVDLIWFTGSTGTGKALYKTAADKFIKVVLEMGGSSPCVVFDDVNPAEVAPVIFSGRFQNCGQVCSALKRLIVHETIADSVVGELKDILEMQVIGDPLSEKTTISSLVAERQQLLLQEQLQDALDKGATIAAQKTIPKDLNGAFVPPTILTNVTKDMRVWKEEVFGPVYPVVTFKDEHEAVELANDTDYGLTSRVISGDLERAHRVASKIDAGSVAINTEARFAPCDPFGGYKNSGMGRERGIHGLRELCQIKVTQESLRSTSA